MPRGEHRLLSEQENKRLQEDLRMKFPNPNRRKRKKITPPKNIKLKQPVFHGKEAPEVQLGKGKKI